MLGNWEWDPVSERFKCNEATFTPHAFAVRANVWAVDRATLKRQLDEVTADRDKAREKGMMLAAGWMHAEACIMLDRGQDIRKAEIPELIDRMVADLSATREPDALKEESREEDKST